MFRQAFYFSTIRKYVTLFGTLFDDIVITRTNSTGTILKFIKVPITYSPKEKMLARVVMDPDQTRLSSVLPLPVMAFETTNFTYDGNRKLNTIRRAAASDTDPNKLKYQYNPVAYNIGFRLYVYVKNAEDGTKIIEQILPYFTPDWTTTIHLIPEMDITLDIPVILNSIYQEDSYSGGFNERQAIIWTLDFTMKGYFYGPVRKAAIIKFANTVLYAPNPEDSIQNSIGNTDAVAYTTTQPGLTANGQPTSTIQNSINPNLITATSDFGYIQYTTEPLTGNTA